MNDLRFAVRQLVKHPGFTLAVVATLALAIGANTAIFSVLDGVLLRPAPLADMDRLALVWETDRNTGTVSEPASVPDFLDLRERSRQLVSLSAFAGMEAIVTPAEGEPTRLAGMIISHNFLATVGITPLIGRGISAEDDRQGAARVVLIGEAFWRRRYQGSSAVLGSTLLLNEMPWTIIGVVPEGAGFGAQQILSAADYGRAFAARGDRSGVDVWIPLAPDPQVFPRSTHPIFLVGRLAPPASVATAQEELAAIAADLEATYPVNQARGVRVEALNDVVFGPVRPALILLLVAVGVVLVVACANVANLLLARGTERFREVAVRTALGAQRRRLARQFLVEGVLLALIGGLGGVLVAFWGTEGLLRLAPGDIPRLDAVGVNSRVLLVTLAVSIAVGVVFGLVPTFQAFRVNLLSTLKSETRGVHTGGPGAQRLRYALVVGQLALAVVLVVGAGLLLRSFWALENVDAGFQADHVVKAEFVLPNQRYPVSFQTYPNLPEIHRYNADLLARVQAMPGVTAAALAGNHPLDAGFTNSFLIVGREAEAAEQPELSIRRASEGYFDAVGLRVIEGRAYGAGDGTGALPVILLNATAAGRFFPDGNAIGQQLRFYGRTWTVIGIVADEHFHGLAESVPVAGYVPLAQSPPVNGAETLLLRVSGRMDDYLAQARDAIRAVDPALAVFGVEPLTTTVSRSMGTRRFTLLLLGTFAGVAVVLALIGVYGMLSYLVARRGAELGIRLALGADRDHLTHLVLRQGMLFAGLGLAIGVAGSLFTTRLLRGLVYGIGTTDPATIVAVAILVTLVTMLASWVPAIRATRVDPMEALRHE